MRRDDQAAHDLAVLIEVARDLGSTFDLTTLLRRIEAAALRSLNCERASLFLLDTAANELYSEAATGVSQLRFPATTGIAGQAVQSRATIIVPDAYADSRFNRRIDEETGFRTRNLMTFPLVGHDGAVVGVLQVLNRITGDFTPADAVLADALSKLAGVAIERQRLLDAHREKLRMQRDLELARQIQQHLLPTENPRVEGYSVAGWNRPADETGGDCFDFFRLDDRRIAFLVADATGHGIGPALIIAQCRAMLRTVATFADDLGRIAGHVNRQLFDDLPEDRFVTAAFGILDPVAHTLSYVSAGHGPLLLLRTGRGTTDVYGATGMPMAILPEQHFEVAGPLPLEPGDVFVLLTDGFYEWERADGEQFGAERIAAVIHNNRSFSSGDLISAIYDATLAFAAGSPQKDDLTAVIIKRCEAAERSNSAVDTSHGLRM